MSKPAWLLLVIAALIFSYYARPFYDFSWVVMSRIRDAVTTRLGAPMVRQERQQVLDSADGQAREMDAYLQGLRDAQSLDRTLAALDFSSTDNYVLSTKAMRARFQESLRYPPPGYLDAITGKVADEPAGEDGIATYRRLEIPVLPGVHAIGYYMRPRNAGARDKLPLVIAAAGRGGIPEPTADGKLPIVQHDSKDFAWEALRRGYAVWLPTFAHFAFGSNDYRDRLAVNAWESGTSLPAIEIAKVVKALDVLTQRDDIDPQRVAMIGHSYGGFYTLYTSALEPRIRVAAVSAYLNDRAKVLDASAPGGFLDWRYPDSLTLWRDPAVVALVAPRPLLFIAGNQDQLFPIEGARRTAPEAARVYKQLGIGERFEFSEFVARHDFNGAAALDFVDKYMGRGAGSPK